MDINPDNQISKGFSITRAVKLFFIVVVLIIFGLFFIFPFIYDYFTVMQAKGATSYLEGYYKQNQSYPSQDEFHKHYGERYDYRFYINSPRHFSLEYPVSQRRIFAFGRPITREWIGGVGSYRVTSCYTGNRCYEFELDKYSNPDLKNNPIEIFQGAGKAYPYANPDPRWIVVLNYPVNYEMEFILNPPYYSNGQHIKFSDIEFDSSYFSKLEFENDYEYPGSPQNIKLRLTGKTGVTNIRYNLIVCEDYQGNKCGEKQKRELAVEIYQ